MALLKTLRKSQFIRTLFETIEMVRDPERIQKIIEREESLFLKKQQQLSLEKKSYELKDVYWEGYDEIPPYYQTTTWIRSRGFAASKHPVAFLKTKNCRMIKLYDIREATREIPGADIFFEGTFYKEESKIPFYFQRMEYFSQHQIVPPKACPSAKLFVNQQFYVDYYQIPLTLNESQRKMITKYAWLAQFKGDVYACPKKDLPNHLKSKKELEVAGLDIPEHATAYWYTGTYCVALYALGEVVEVTEQDDSSEITTNNSKKELSPVVFKKGFLVKGEWLKNPTQYLMLDTETTGLRATDEIIQLAVVNLKGERVYQQYFKPSQPVGDSYKVHKLSDNFLSDKPSWAACWKEIESVLKGKTILIQNASFDVKMINQTCSRYGVGSKETFHYKDTMGYFRKMVKKGSLKDVMTILNIEHDDQKLHDAIEDCLKTIEALNKTLEL